MQQGHVTRLAPGEGRAVHLAGDTYTFKAVGETTGGLLTLFEGLVPPGGGPPPHIHQRESEYYYVLEGELELTQADGRSSPVPERPSPSRRARCTGSRM